MLRIIARSTLARFVASLAGRKEQAAVKASLDAWFYEVERVFWDGPADIKRSYGTASIINFERVVFNVKGNDFRLVASVDFGRKIVYIKWVGSHADYDK